VPQLSPPWKLLHLSRQLTVSTGRGIVVTGGEARAGKSLVRAKAQQNTASAPGNSRNTRVLGTGMLRTLISGAQAGLTGASSMHRIRLLGCSQGGQWPLPRRARIRADDVKFDLD